MTLSHRRMSTLLVVTLSTAIIAMTLGVVAGGQSAGGSRGHVRARRTTVPESQSRPWQPEASPGPRADRISATYVRNRDVAIALGKAFFWDMQVGSDGVQACASCHFRAGADPRSINQLNPGGADNPDPTINLGGPNYQLKASDFPFHKLADPTDRHSNGDPRHRRCRVVAGRAPAAVRRRRARRDERHRDADSRSGVQHRRHQHASGGAAQHADDDQRCVQLQQFLGPARAQHLQRIQRARGRRFGGAGAARHGPRIRSSASSSASTTRAWRRRQSVRR